MENVCSGRKGSEISRVKSHPHAVGSIGLFCLAAGSWEESAGAMWLSRNHPLTPEFSSLNSLGWSSALSQRGRFWSKIWWFLQEKRKMQMVWPSFCFWQIIIQNWCSLGCNVISRKYTILLYMPAGKLATMCTDQTARAKYAACIYKVWTALNIPAANRHRKPWFLN